MDRAIVLVPVGEAEARLLAETASLLANRLDRRVVVGEPVPLPEEAYDPKRRQYRGDSILIALGRLPASHAERLVGIVEADCYFDGLNFIFGQAVGRGREVFVALPRLRPSSYGLPEDPELFRERVLKEVVHELGHSWGLEHCSNERCVMYFSNSLEDTDRKAADLCPSCQARAPRAKGMRKRHRGS